MGGVPSGAAPLGCYTTIPDLEVAKPVLAVNRLFVQSSSVLSRP
jgi:hypothetical protein